MTKKVFFANAASKALALAAVLMMSLGLASCGGNNDDDGGGKQPELPVPNNQTIRIDDKEYPIKSTQYEYLGGGMYELTLSLSDFSGQKVVIRVDKKHHMTGNEIELSKKENTHDGLYWGVTYYDKDNKEIFDTWGKPNHNVDAIFNTGTLSVKGQPDGNIEIILLNGRVKGTDGKEHTLVMSYSGTMNLYENYGEKGNVNIDDISKRIKRVKYEDKSNGNYKIHLYLGDTDDEEVVIQLNKNYHIGKPVDLTQKESSHSGNYWGVAYYDNRSDLLVDTWGNPDDSRYVFTYGILDITGSVDGNISIKLKSGYVRGDGEDYSITLYYSGRMSEILPTPEEPKLGWLTIDGRGTNIQSAVYDEVITGAPNTYRLIYYFDKKKRERVEFRLNHEEHFAKTTNLAVSESNPGTMSYWEIKYFNSDGIPIIEASALANKPHFKTGELTITGNNIQSLELLLRNGVVMGTDNKLHTFVLRTNEKPEHK